MLFCGACVAVFLTIASGGDTPRGRWLTHWLYPSGYSIWCHGRYWAVVTSTLVHREVLHLGFNVYWLWQFGRLLEPAIGRRNWLLLFVSAGVISSGCELAVTGNTGIGVSGVLYAMFGFMVVTRQRWPQFRSLLTWQTIAVLLGWLWGCFIVTYAGMWNVGNAAHLTGLLFGGGVGLVFGVRRYRAGGAAGIAVLTVSSIVPLLWAPWCSDWTASRGTRAFNRKDYAAAAAWYHKSLELGGDPVWVWRCLAYTYFLGGHDTGLKSALTELRKVDPEEEKRVRDDLVEDEAPAASRPASEPG